MDEPHRAVPHHHRLEFALIVDAQKKSGLGPVDLTTVQERVYQTLRLGLLKGEFLPGETISIRGLADVLGTSPMPVRDAVARLIAERAVEQSGPRSLRVAPYVAAEHEAYIRIRMQLEGYASERAALTWKDPDLLERLREINRSISEASDAGDFDSALAGNQAFHFEVYAAAGLPPLLEIVSTLWLRTGPILASARQDDALFERLFQIGVQIHDDAIEAIARRDGAAARRAITLDIRASHFSIRRFVKRASGEPNAGQGSSRGAKSVPASRGRALEQA
ncbi:GntR family transcriptional regulator [Fulvimarina endophytica]|uniref:GntR family transcriptional regulator n=1 Tax=Fulvimarina endophytica TaxID=2293836 RepID=A0A371X9U1_9HYPH|nr:GntR family transcriptional regulator [Fulvimarina endophytica]RFC65962.1 GntR family transcriptional regulator [Fulvimarina endophytica]